MLSFILSPDLNCVTTSPADWLGLHWMTLVREGDPETLVMSLWNDISLKSIYLLLLASRYALGHECDMHVWRRENHLWRGSSPSTFMWVPRIDPGLQVCITGGKSFHLLSWFASLKMYTSLCPISWHYRVIFLSCKQNWVGYVLPYSISQQTLDSCHEKAIVFNTTVDQIRRKCNFLF